MTFILGMLPKSGGVSLPISLNYVTNYSSDVNNTNYTSGSISLGSAAASGDTRHILVGVHGGGGTNGQVNAVTIGGVSASRLHQISSSEPRPLELWYLQNNGSTSGIVTAEFSTLQSGVVLSVWNLTNPGSITPSDTASDVATGLSASASITMPTGGVGLVLLTTNLAFISTPSWTNATSQYNVMHDGFQELSGAKTTGTGTFSVEAAFTGSSAQISMSVIAWAKM